MTIAILNKLFNRKRKVDYVGEAILICAECHNKVPIKYCPRCGSTHIKKVIKYSEHTIGEIKRLVNDNKELKTKLNRRQYRAKQIAEEILKYAQK